MLIKLVLLMLSCCFSVIWSQQKACQMYFTLQPPVDIPCNPYIFRNTTLTLQCMVSAPVLNAYLQEVNFTIEWLRIADIPGALEEIIYPGEGGFEVVIKRSSHTHGETGLVSVFVKSSLSLDMNQASHMELSGKYWCRVLEKNLENYSYSIAGDSCTATVLKLKSHYPPNYPPCVEEISLHHAELKCVEVPLNYVSPQITLTASTCSANKDYILVSRGNLDAIAIVGAILVILLLIMSFMELNSCLNIRGHSTKGLYIAAHEARHVVCDLNGNPQQQHHV